MRSLNAAPGYRHRRWGSVDRYLLSPADQQVLGYFVQRLYVPYGLRTRLLCRAIRSPLKLASPELLLDATWSGEMDRHPVLSRVGEPGSTRQREAVLLQGLEESPEVLQAAGFTSPVVDRIIVRRDSGGADCGRLLLFCFRPGAGEPSAIVKIRDRRARGPALRVEYEALRQVRTYPAIAPTVPEPLLYTADECAEILVLSSVPGVSAYVEMHRSLRPAQRVKTHFAAAAEWLADFHGARRTDTSTAGVADGLGRPGTLGHGDYWARNLLLRYTGKDRAGAAVAVVDWECFSEACDPLGDLIHFPLTYGLNYPWRRRGRVPIREAFRRTFLSRTGLGGHVASYFHTYCDRARMPRGRLRPGLEALLQDRARTVGAPDRDEWRACGEALSTSRETAVDP